jgi:hypothetical protein
MWLRHREHPYVLGCKWPCGGETQHGCALYNTVEGVLTLLAVVQDVCAAVGVERPASVFAGINANRTMAEMLALATEMAQRIAYDTRDWTRLMQVAYFAGTGEPDITRITLPADFRRMLLTTNVRKSSNPNMPMIFIPDLDVWTQHVLANSHAGHGEWIIYRGLLGIRPPLPVSETITFSYLDRNCIGLAGGGYGDAFMNDNDNFVLDERVLKLGMIWQWKALKGSPYAEDMANYQDALTRVSGADKPAPIIIGRLPISAAVNQSYPFPVDPGMVPL